MSIQYYIILCLTLFSIGVVGVLTRRNAIIVFMCIELMLNAVNLLLVAFSKMYPVACVATTFLLQILRPKPLSKNPTKGHKTINPIIIFMRNELIL